MAAGYPSGTNTFVPSFEASGNLIISYSRSPSRFPLNKYCAIKKTTKDQGYYLNLTAQEAARVINNNLAEFAWPDGNDAPSNSWGNESFNFLPFLTQRYEYGFQIGYKATEQADWKILSQYAAIKAQQAMTARTLLGYTQLVTTTNYTNTVNLDTATNWSSRSGTPGFLNTGTGANPVLKAALNKMAQAINIATLGSVEASQLRVVISPIMADALGRSQEIHDFLRESPFALAQVRGDSPNQNGIWGLPTEVYGFPIIVENTVRVTSKKGATLAEGYLADTISGSNIASGSTGNLIMLAAPGQLVSEAGGVDFSSLHIFAYEEMTVETKDDPDNRRTKGRVVEDIGAYLVAPAATALCTHSLS